MISSAARWGTLIWAATRLVRYASDTDVVIIAELWL
jgi:hypothetical protein